MDFLRGAEKYRHDEMNAWRALTLKAGNALNTVRMKAANGTETSLTESKSAFVRLRGELFCVQGTIKAREGKGDNAAEIVS